MNALKASDAAETAAVSPAVTIVIPAFNEAKRITKTLAATIAYFQGKNTLAEILVCDDGSTDDTAGVVMRWATENNARNTVKILRYDTNRGKGYAIRYGMLRAHGDFVLFMDADLATPIEEIEKLYAAIARHDNQCVAIGSRTLKESQLLVRQPLYREILGKSFNKIVQLMAAPGIIDTQCGFKLFPRHVAQAIFSKCTLDGFSFDVEIIFLARKLGYYVAEIPVRWAHQEGAAAFPNARAYIRHGLRMLRDLPAIRWAHRSVRPVFSTVSKPRTTA